MSREKQLVHTNKDLNNNVIESTALSSVGPPALSMLVADSGVTSYFVTIKAPIINRTRTTKPLAITTANGAVIYSSHTAELNLPNLPLTARICHVVPHLGDFSLISVGQLCDAGCDVTFTRKKWTSVTEETLLCRADGRATRDFDILTSITMMVLQNGQRYFSKITEGPTKLSIGFRVQIPRIPSVSQPWALLDLQTWWLSTMPLSFPLPYPL